MPEVKDEILESCLPHCSTGGADYLEVAFEPSQPHEFDASLHDLALGARSLSASPQHGTLIAEPHGQWCIAKAG
jgi:hypothetical protein